MLFNFSKEGYDTVSTKACYWTMKTSCLGIKNANLEALKLKFLILKKDSNRNMHLYL